MSPCPRMTRRNIEFHQDSRNQASHSATGAQSYLSVKTEVRMCTCTCACNGSLEDEHHELLLNIILRMKILIYS